MKCAPVVIRRFSTGFGGESQGGSAAVDPVLRLCAVRRFRIVIGVLTLVAAESTAEGLLALGSLAHEATCALRATETASALRSHAEAAQAALHARGCLTVPGARRRLVAELAEGSRCCRS